MYRSLLFLLTFLTLSVHGKSINRVEPPNWWTDMEHNLIQLMIHGDNIAKLVPKINHSQVSIFKVHRTDNPNYLFIDLSLSDKLNTEDIKIGFYQDDKEVLSHSYPILKRRKHSKQKQGFSPKDTIYLITPDRFANGDTKNDTVKGMKEGLNRAFKGGRHGGDIQGVIDHLDYIQKMGFTQIWLNPILENNMAEYSYHGYSTTDYYQVDPRFGSNALYTKLSQQAKDKGIGIIMDVVLNHIGSEHWWMKDMPSKDWLNQHSQYTGTNHYRESLNDPYAVQSDKDLFTKGWFVPTMPDLNQQNPLVANYLIQNAIWCSSFHTTAFSVC